MTPIDLDKYKLITNLYDGPYLVSDYFTNRIALFPDKQDFFLEKQKEILKDYPLAYQIDETKSTYQSDKYGIVLKYSLKITSRQRKVNLANINKSNYTPSSFRKFL